MQQPRRRYNPDQPQEPMQLTMQPETAQRAFFCSQCGTRAEPGAKFCTQCGAPLHGALPAQQPVVVNVSNDSKNTVVVQHDVSLLKSQWTAFFLCLFGGWLGLHRFYLGKTWSGIVWAFTFGFFFVGWMVDLLLLLFNVPTDKWGRPLR